MHLYVALASSLISLALVLAIYHCNIRAHPGSWLRGDMLAMILLSLLTVLLPLALAATGMAGWSLTTEAAVAGWVVAPVLELVSLAALIAAVIVFRALVIATYRATPVAGTVTPLTPHPKPGRPTPAAGRRAA